MSDNQNFCVKCGQVLSESDKYCPACGARVPGRSPEQVEAEKQLIRDSMSSRLNWAVALMLIYSIPFIIIGIWIMADLNGIVDTIWTDPLYADYIDYYGLTQTEIHDLFYWASITYIISSICGIVSAVLCYKRIVYWGAVLLCLISMFTGAAGLFALFMGLFAFWIIITSRPIFSKYTDELDQFLEEQIR